MSAIAVVPAANGIIFAADAAAYDVDGNILYFATKLYCSAAGRWGWGHVGIGSFGFHLANAIAADGGDDQSFDELSRKLLRLARVAYEQATIQWFAEGGDAPVARATMICGGWSFERQRFELVKLHSNEKDGVNLETGERVIFAPWELIPVSGMWASSLPREADLQRFGIDWDDYSPLDLPARLVCALRASCDDRGDAVYGVGGRLEMLVITADGVKRWVAHSWPDEIGRPIDPNLGEPMPAFPLRVPA